MLKRVLIIFLVIVRQWVTQGTLVHLFWLAVWEDTIHGRETWQQEQEVVMCSQSGSGERERLVVSSLTLSPDPFIHCRAPFQERVLPTLRAGLPSSHLEMTSHTHTEVCFLGASKPTSWHCRSTISKVLFVVEKAQRGFFLFCCFCFCFLIWKSYPGRWKWFYGLLRKIKI